MTPEDFAARLVTAVVDENTAIYRGIFTSTAAETARDPYWNRALTLFGSLPAEQREVFFDILRQVTVDTASNVLGILDGTLPIGDTEGGFSLTHDESEQLNGELQDHFLAEVERRE